jgi:uroporphyrinogen-III synthase
MTASRATVGVTADRRGEDQERMLERYGLRVVRGPMLGTVMVTEDGPLRAVTDDLIAHPPAYVIANTGIGVRSWLTAAAGWGRAEALRAMLSNSRVAARGPKAVGALRSADVAVWWQAPSETLRETVDHVAAQGIAGSRVALQLHGDPSDEVQRLVQAGADVVEVPVYRWTVPADARAAMRLVELTCDGEIDAVTFTSAPAVRAFVDLARSVGLADQLLDAVNTRVLVACVGPVCAAAAREVGMAAPRHPEHWRLGSLVRMVAEELAAVTR